MEALGEAVDDPVIAGWLHKEEERMAPRSPSPIPLPLLEARRLPLLPPSHHRARSRSLPLSLGIALLAAAPLLPALGLPALGFCRGLSRADFLMCERHMRASRWYLETMGAVRSRLPEASVTGADLEAHCRRAIERLPGAFYIGITEAPVMRWTDAHHRMGRHVCDR